MRLPAALSALAVLLTVGVAARSQDKAAVIASTGKALQDQLACLVPPKPGLAIRAMLRNGLLAKTDFGGDGVPVFRSTGDLTVFGKRVLFVSGWEMEGDRVREPFYRAPGTAPPRFVAVILNAAPGDVAFRPHEVRGADGVAQGPLSSIEPTRESYAKSGATVECSG